MEKSQIPKNRPHQSKPNLKPSLSSEPKSSRAAVWDCGSTLYDSFELTSFQRHLDSAITATSARSLSMPHHGSADIRRLPEPSVTAPSTAGSKLSRSLQKLLRSVFKSKAPSNANASSGKEKGSRGDGDRDKKSLDKETARWFVVYEDDDIGFEKDRKEKGVTLSTIAEAPDAEKNAALMSPEIGPAVRKTMSERFSAASVSNRVNMISSCA